MSTFWPRQDNSLKASVILRVLLIRSLLLLSSLLFSFIWCASPVIFPGLSTSPRHRGHAQSFSHSFSFTQQKTLFLFSVLKCLPPSPRVCVCVCAFFNSLIWLRDIRVASCTGKSFYIQSTVYWITILQPSAILYSALFCYPWMGTQWFSNECWWFSRLKENVTCLRKICFLQLLQKLEEVIGACPITSYLRYVCVMLQFQCNISQRRDIRKMNALHEGLHPGT